MPEIRWEIKKGYQAYRAVSDTRLKNWIRERQIKKGEVSVWRSGLSGFRQPEALDELRPYFEEYARQTKAHLRRKGSDHRWRSSQKGQAIKNLLIIDDEQDLTRYLAQFLTESGYHVSIASSGKEAVQKLKKNKIDLIFLDENLPDISGVRLLPKLKRIRRNWPVVMISGYGSEELKKQVKDLGVQFFLDKPFNLKTILRTIKDCQHDKGSAH